MGHLVSFPQFSDWKELVKEGEHDNLEALIKEYESAFTRPVLAVSESAALFPPPSLYFDKNVQKLAEMFGTDLEKGLSSELVSKHESYYGTNKLPDPKKPSILSMLWTQLSDFMIVILLVVAIVEFATEDYKAGIVLLLVVIMNATIGFTQEYKANKALEALTSLSVPKATVIRNGQQETIDSVGLVPGDLVVLDEGDAVPADLRLCEVSQLEIVEAILTGESIGVLKSVRTIRQRV